MLTYNRPQFISRAIESVVRQDFQAWELIVVNDGVNPRTDAVIEEWQARDERIRYFRRGRPGNIADATNFGLSAAQGDYIAILDDDDYWASPDKLLRQLRFLEEHPEYAGCGGGVVVIDETGKEKLRYLKPQSDGQIRARALLANPIAHSTSLYRRAAAQQLGGYDTALAGFQDWDLWLKMGRVGKLYNFPEYLTYYCLWSGGGSFQQHARNTRCALRIVCRHRSSYPHFAAALAFALAQHAYACLPHWVRAPTFSLLSRMKKALFGRVR